MKVAVSILCLFLSFSCNDRGETYPAPKDSVSYKDTLSISKEEVNPYAPVDVSPMDMSYFPDDYPVLKMSDKVSGLPFVRVIYSRPHRQGRKIFGGLLKYGEPWRLGANEATEIEFFKPAVIQKQKINAGRYIVYCVPKEDSWEICFNTNIYSWGLKHDPKKDVHHFKIPVRHIDPSIEYFTIVFEKKPYGTDMVMVWDDVETRLPIQF